jgi:hypothetical protein
MVRDDFIALCAGSFMFAGGFGWFGAPETGEFKLAKIRSGLNLSIPIRTLPPESKAVRCMMVWVGGPGSAPELWCPPRPPLPEEQASPTGHLEKPGG